MYKRQVYPCNDFGRQRHGAVGYRHTAGERRDQRLEQACRPVIVALIERVDGTEIAAEPQLDGVACRDRFDFGEQPFGLGEFAQI